jgi:hypothetical protein
MEHTLHRLPMHVVRTVRREAQQEIPEPKWSDKAPRSRARALERDMKFMDVITF